jgi:sporulation related protein
MSGHLSKFAVCRSARLGLAVTLAVCAAPAFGETPVVSYPPSRALGDIATWLQRDTPISLGQVVDVSPSAVTAVTSATPMGETRGFLATISSEATDPDVPARQGIVAWSISVEVDCERHAVRLGTMTGYPGRDLRTEPRLVRPADTSWVTPTPGAPLGAVTRALCDRDFKRPFGGRLQVASKAPEPARAAAAHEAPPLALRPTLPPEPVAPAKPRPSPVAGGLAVQIGASPSLPDIQGLLARFKKAFAANLDGLTTNVATVQVDGKTVNRALISGFASTAEANGFCKTLEAAGQACFVRR